MTRDEHYRLNSWLAIHAAGWRWYRASNGRGGAWLDAPNLTDAQLGYRGHERCESDRPRAECWAINVPEFSTDWRAMGTLVEAMRTKGYDFEAETAAREPAEWYAEFDRFVVGRGSDPVGESAPTLPEAVALACYHALAGRPWQGEVDRAE